MGPNNLDFLSRQTKGVRLTGIICNWARGSKGNGKESVFLIYFNNLKSLRLNLSFITRPYSSVFESYMTHTSQLQQVGSCQHQIALLCCWSCALRCSSLIYPGTWQLFC